MFSGMIDGLLSDPTFKEWKGYMRSGMDYMTDLMPDRETMKGYIDGPYDDYVIDKVADGYGYIRGLLDEAPSTDPYAGYDPTAEHMDLKRPSQAYDPTAEIMAVKAQPQPKSIAELFQGYGGMPKGGGRYGEIARPAARPRPAFDYMDNMPAGNQRPAAPPPQRPMENYMDNMPAGNQRPYDLLAGQLGAKGVYDSGEAVIQSMPSRDFARPIKDLQDMSSYLDNSTRDRVQRDIRLNTRQRGANAALNAARYYQQQYMPPPPNPFGGM